MVNHDKPQTGPSSSMEPSLQAATSAVPSPATRLVDLMTEMKVLRERLLALKKRLAAAVELARSRAVRAAVRATEERVRRERLRVFMKRLAAANEARTNGTDPYAQGEIDGPRGDASVGPVVETTDTDGPNEGEDSEGGKLASRNDGGSPTNGDPAKRSDGLQWPIPSINNKPSGGDLGTCVDDGGHDSCDTPKRSDGLQWPIPRVNNKPVATVQFGQ
ncbi:uncharacterized protein LOC62_02G002914 [Vanrija pseudolonga]|uniref:Uncharacterized protein n=1 Tax=Vanrija pseudolonga TaxID=143232 RepID=A0AAF0Y3F4_9TREE|nr:hypothetical protein LOC62_02G002914 [Vanrija pseudolonga]